MAAAIGRARVTRIHDVHGGRRKNVELVTDAFGNGHANDVGRPQKTYRLDGKEQGSDANAAVDDYLDEVGRIGAVYVLDDDSLVPEGHYLLESVDGDKPRGRPKVRPWNASLIRTLSPYIVLQAEDGILRPATRTTAADFGEGVAIQHTLDATSRAIAQFGLDFVFKSLLRSIGSGYAQDNTDATSENVDSAGGAGINTRIATKFTTSGASFVQEIGLTCAASAGGAKATVRIETDSSGSPSGALVHANLEKTGVTVPNNSFFAARFDKGAPLAASTTYWIVIIATIGSFTLKGTTGGTADQCKVFRDAAWNLDATVENLMYIIVADDDGYAGDTGLSMVGETSGLANQAVFKAGINIFGPLSLYGGMRPPDFDGTTAYIEAPDSDSLDIYEGSVEAWVYPDNVAAGLRGIVTKGTKYFLKQSGASVIFGITLILTEQITASSALTAGAWNHIVGVFKKGEFLKLYVNGVESATAAPTSTTQYLGANTDPLRIGSKDGVTEFFDGAIWDVRVLRYPMNASEVRRRYDSTKSLTAAPSTTVDRYPSLERLNLPAGKWKVLYRSKVTTGTYSVRLGLIDDNGVEQAGLTHTGTQTTLQLRQAGTITVASANDKQNHFLVKVSAISGVGVFTLDEVILVWDGAA